MNGGFFKSHWQLLASAVVVLVGALAFLCWHQLTSPQTVFNDMLVNNLSTRSVTKNQIVSSGSEADVQRASIVFGPEYVARSLVTVRNSSGAVTTETLATPTSAYLRYASITDTAGKHNYDRVKGVWAKAGNDTNGKALRQVFNKSILDLSIAPVPPLGEVSVAKREELLAFIRDQSIFKPDYKSVKGEIINGREVFTYNVTVRLAPYLRMMQEFGSIYGLHDLDSIKPSEYQSATLTLKISADKLSHTMVRVSSAQLGLNETFTDYGLRQHIELPTKTVPVSELQKRLKAIQ